MTSDFSVSHLVDRRDRSIALWGEEEEDLRIAKISKFSQHTDGWPRWEETGNLV